MLAKDFHKGIELQSEKMLGDEVAARADNYERDVSNK
jgi:hypothetical protein